MVVTTLQINFHIRTFIEVIYKVRQFRKAQGAYPLIFNGFPIGSTVPVGILHRFVHGNIATHFEGR